MPSNKDRLYVCLYARGGSSVMPDRKDEYHWAFMIGPKAENEHTRGTRYHVQDHITSSGKKQWAFQERSVSLSATNMLLIRVMVGKVNRLDRLLSALHSVPVRQVHGWNCVIWLQEALRAIEADKKALGTCVTEWSLVKNTAMRFCQQKKREHRFKLESKFDRTKPPTLDLVRNKVIIP
jgi:hypothetical protein